MSLVLPIVAGIAGIDEAGRGAWAGPVVAAVVCLAPDRPIQGLNDSKKLSPAKRMALADDIKNNADDWALGYATSQEVDRLNVLQASMLAMQRAFHALNQCPIQAVVDGPICPALSCPAQPLVKGDSQHASIAAASILAKVERDAYMLRLHCQWPQYGFDRHKGYGTKVHRAALHQYGHCDAHRQSFKPVLQAMA